MGYKFDEKGFMVTPDPRDYRRKNKEHECKCVVIKHAYCPNGHDLMWEQVNFNGFDGIKLKVVRPNGEEGKMILSPVFGDQTIVYVGMKPVDGEKLEVFCPVCEIKIPVLEPCDNCDGGEMCVLSLVKDYDITNGIASCDMVACPNSYILDSGELIKQAYLEEL